MHGEDPLCIDSIAAFVASSNPVRVKEMRSAWKKHRTSNDLTAPYFGVREV